jgi:hypothetical protein
MSYLQGNKLKLKLIIGLQSNKQNSRVHFNGKRNMMSEEK